jgi:Xaa-Pro dipeptidase
MSEKEYPREEMELRWRRAHERMEIDGLDAIIVTERGNFWHLAGVRSSTQFYNKMRPTVAILPRGKPPTLIVYSLEKERLGKGGWVTDIRTYTDAPFPPQVGIDVLKDIGLSEAKIGMEYGESQRVWFSINHLEAIKAGLPQAQFVDGSSTIEWLRLHKTQLEVEKLRKSIATSQRAYNRLVPRLEPGMTMGQVAKDFAGLLIEEGCDGRSPAALGGDFLALPPDHVLGPGSVLWSDWCSVQDGFTSDIARRAAFTPLAPNVQRDQEWLWQVISKCASALGPGVPMADIHRLHNEELARLGFDPLPAGKRIGHGLGIDPSEPPSLSADTDALLEPGMVVTVEPRFPASYGKAHIEEVYVITENGYEMISGGEGRDLSIVG